MTKNINSFPENEGIEVMIIALEKQALELWNQGNPDGFIDLSSDDIVYIDPALGNKLEGKKALEAYYSTIRGKVNIDSYKMIKPIVRLSSDVAILIYDYEAQREGRTFRMHCTEFYRLFPSKLWKITHTHWSFVLPEPK